MRWKQAAIWSGLLGMLLCICSVRGDEPAQPCAADQLLKAQAALKDAQVELAKSDKDPRKPPAGKFTKDFENDKSAADGQVKLAEGSLKDAQEMLDKAKARFDELQNKLGVKWGGQTQAQLQAVELQNQEKFKQAQARLDQARQAQAKFDKDPAYADQAAAVRAGDDTLKQELNRCVAPDQLDDIQSKLSDPSQRAAITAALNDRSYQDLEFTGTTPDGDVLGHAERLLDNYKTLSHQSEDLRQKIQAVAQAARGGDPKAYDQLRNLGPQLVAQIDQARKAVIAAVDKRNAAQDGLIRRAQTIDTNGAALIEQMPQDNQEIEAINKAEEALGLQKQLAAEAGNVKEEQKIVDQRQQDVNQAKSTAAAAAKALADTQAYSTSLEPLIKKEKDAQDAVSKLQKQVEDDGKAKDSALTKAKSDYAANEADLRAFREKVLKEKADIDKLASTNADDAKAKLKALRDEVKDKKAEAVKKLQAMQSALDPFRQCFRDANEYVENILKPKIHSLGGTAEAGIAVSDTDDPMAVLLDVPVDKDSPASAPVETWVRHEAVFHSGDKDGRKPPGMEVSVTSLTFKTNKDGKDWTNSMQWNEPPAELHRGDVVTLTMTASAEQGWGGVSGWWNFNGAVSGSGKGDNGASSDKNFRAKSPHAGTYSYVFDPGGSEAYIQVSAGHDPNPDQWVLVTWKYEKKK